MNRYRLLGMLMAVTVIFFVWANIAFAQDQFPNVPDDTVSVVQLWMVAFGILTTAIASLMRLLPFNDWPDLTKRIAVVVISVVLAAIGLIIQNDLVPEVWIRSSLTILIVASGIYALLGKTIQDSVAGVKTIAIEANTDVSKGVPASKIVDPGH